MSLSLSSIGLERVSRSGWMPLAGTLLFAALVPLVRYPALTGVNVALFLLSFCLAGLAYVFALRRLRCENPAPGLIWGFAVLFRLAMLVTPVTLSEDVYRYAWDGHLLLQGINPYAHPVESPLLDGYETILRGRVNYPWMATPYLPAAQLYFAVVEGIAPQNPFAFQVSAAALDLLAGALLFFVLPRLSVPSKAALIYLWNPLVVVEFAHGAHVDALMIFFLAASLWGAVHGSQIGLTLSSVFLAAAVLVKGWPLMVAPLFVRRWGLARVGLFGACVVLPLALFAATAGWGIGGPADGTGVFGAVRIYAAEWTFNGGLYRGLELLFSPGAARLIAAAIPGLLGLVLGGLAWRQGAERAGETISSNLRLVRQMMAPFGLYLLLAPTIHPWYLTLVLVLLPFFWPAHEQDAAAQRWIWPWVYFMFFEAFTYLAYSGLTASEELPWIQLAGYLPFWGMLVWAGWRMSKKVGFVKI